MKLQLNSCGAARPDKRAITKMLEEIASGIGEYEAREMTDILLDGDPVEIDVSDKTTSSAFRSLRKLDIDYDIL